MQIIEQEYHPSSQNQGPTISASGSKEALSVYGLFYHLAHTPQGKQRLRQCFLRPTTDSALINERLDFISAFLRPENMDALSLTIKSLKGIKNMRPIMINIRKGASGLRKSGGISNGIWSTLRSVSVNDKEQDCLTKIEISVRVSYFANIGRFRRSCRRSEASNMVQGTRTLEKALLVLPSTHRKADSGNLRYEYDQSHR